MFKTYAITIQQTSGKVSEVNYNRALDRIVKSLNVKIINRSFETGGVAHRLHVHATIQQYLSHPGLSLTHKMVEDTLQKNQKRAFYFKEIFDPKGWQEYVDKDKKTPPKVLSRSQSAGTFATFDLRKYSSSTSKTI